MSDTTSNGRKSVRASSALPASTRGCSRWLSHSARPWPGRCLMTGSTPPSRKPVQEIRARLATSSGSSEKARSPITSWEPSTGTSQTGAQSTVMPASCSMDAIRRACQPCRLGPGFRIAGREVADPAGRRKGRPFRRTHPGDPAAFLVDQDGSVRTPDRGPQVGDERPDLIGRLAVAAEQDEAEGIGLPEELAFFRGEGGTGAAVDDRGGKLRGGSLLTDGQECTRRSVT